MVWVNIYNELVFVGVDCSEGVEIGCVCFYISLESVCCDIGGGVKDEVESWNGDLRVGFDSYWGDYVIGVVIVFLESLE